MGMTVYLVVVVVAHEGAAEIDVGVTAKTTRVHGLAGWLTLGYSCGVDGGAWRRESCDGDDEPYEGEKLGEVRYQHCGGLAVSHSV